MTDRPEDAESDGGTHRVDHRVPDLDPLSDADRDGDHAETDEANRPDTPDPTRHPDRATPTDRRRRAARPAPSTPTPTGPADPSDDLHGFDDLTTPDDPDDPDGPDDPDRPDQRCADRASPRRSAGPDSHTPTGCPKPGDPTDPGDPTRPPDPPGHADPLGQPGPTTNASLSDRSRGRPEPSRAHRRAAERARPRRRRVRELPRPEVLLIIHSDHPDTVYTATGQPLPDGTHNPLFTDPDLYTAVIDSLGVPLDMGRKVRLATTTQRRAARIRDGGCVFPGCDEPPERCRMHHINLWDHGGLTDFAVLAALCPHHHGVTHRNHWHMHATPDAWFYWQTPTGRTVECLEMSDTM